MDTEPVFIGSNTKTGRKIQGPPNFMTRRPQNKQTSHPKGKVDVYADGEFVKEMPLGVLVRFSKVAAAAFPKPGAANEEKKAEDTEGQEAPRDYDEEEAKDLDVQKLTADVKKLTTKSEGEETTPKTSEATAKETKALTAAAPSKEKEPAKPGKKELRLKLDTIWVQPPVSAFEYAFKWMHEAKVARPGDQVLDYCVPRPEELSVPMLIDLYAAALCLDVRPFPHKIRHHILGRVTEQTPLLEDIVYVHEHLPIDDPIMTRTVTSYFEHAEPPNDKYTRDEHERIFQYVKFEDPALDRRFGEIQTARTERGRKRRQHRGGNKMQQIAEGGATANAAAGQAVNGDAGGEGEAKTAGNGRRRDRRKVENKGNGSKGGAVGGSK